MLFEARAFGRRCGECVGDVPPLPLPPAGEAGSVGRGTPTRALVGAGEAGAPTRSLGGEGVMMPPLVFSPEGVYTGREPADIAPGPECVSARTLNGDDTCM